MDKKEKKRYNISTTLKKFWGRIQYKCNINGDSCKGKEGKPLFLIELF